MDCRRFAPMLTAREGELDAGERATLGEHLSGCARCRAELADFTATEGLVREALLAEAARRDFAPFVDAVMARTHSASGGSAEARAVTHGRAEPVEAGTAWDGLIGWVRRHRFAAATGAIAPAVAGIALIMYVASDRPAGPQVGEVVVVAEGRVPMVLRTADGPVVLLGPPDGGT
jgi:anti-sigma factor RsiW